ncbi:sensor domain-containing diguanylate cyclase [Pseudomonas lijiangensis]|uniref:sensor domain-containing diguanylate cyclase n=1 Tax=Pseudomonas lijiangensis TaxID=2995658 RepID=UPI0031BBC01E
MSTSIERPKSKAFFLGLSFCLLLSLGITLVLICLPDQPSAISHIELALIIQTLFLGSLCVATYLRQKQSQVQFDELIAQKNQISFLNARITNLINAATQVAVVTTDAQGHTKLFSDGAQALFGFSREEMLERNNVQMLYVKEDIDARRQQLTDPALLELTDKQLIRKLSNDENDVSKPTEWTYRRKDGSQFTGELRHARFSDVNSGEIEHISVIIDVSERIELLNNIQKSKALLTQLTPHIPNMLYQFHLRAPGDGHFSFCSPSIEDIFELKAEAVIGVNFADNPLFKRLHPDDLPLIRAVSVASVETGDGWMCDFRVVLPAKGVRWLRGDAHAERQADQTFIWYGSFSDITELKDREEKLRTQAVTDELTGICNRRHFISSLEQLVDTGKRYATPFSLITFDLDHFKSINDRFGHGVGDTVLQQVCTVIRQRLRSSDIFCRIGGEELAILCPLTSYADTEKLANMLCQALADHEIAVAGRVTASFGFASWTKDLSAEELLSLADMASYTAKKNGRNRVIGA